MSLKNSFALMLLACILLGACRPKVQSNPNLLDQVLASGQLRVGTTGDYQPFSYRSDTADFTGIDIELAYDLAASLGVEVVFVQTSWPTLLEDLQAKRFDIAMGGISKSLKRQQVGLLSSGYATTGKTPIGRCGDLGQFVSLEQIDQPSVRIIVNPGGTNHQFVQENIKQAQVILHPENITIFEEIIAGRADVMITDAHEVLLESKLSNALCPMMPGKTFNKFEKAYLLPRDLLWKEYVDAWLEMKILDGTVEKVFQQYL